MHAVAPAVAATVPAGHAVQMAAGKTTVPSAVVSTPLVNEPAAHGITTGPGMEVMFGLMFGREPVNRLFARPSVTGTVTLASHAGSVPLRRLLSRRKVSGPLLTVLLTRTFPSKSGIGPLNWLLFKYLCAGRGMMSLAGGTNQSWQTALTTKSAHGQCQPKTTACIEAGGDRPLKLVVV